MADAHHAAAQGDERRGGEAEFLSAQQQGDGDIVAAHQLAVRLQRHALAQVVAAQHLMGLGQPDLPGQARVVNAAHRRGPGAALAAGDEDALAPALATPLAMVPTPPEETSLTVTRASSLAHCRS